MSTPTPATTVLENIGNDLLNLIVCTSTELVLITVYSMLVIKTTIILLGIRRRNPEGKGPVIMLLVVFLMYLVNVICLIIDLVDLVAEVRRIILVKNTGIDLDTEYAQARNFTARGLAAIDVLYGYLTCLGDGIIVWRVYAFWASSHIRHLIMAVPIGLVLASVACSIMLTYCVGRLGPVETGLGAVLHPEFCRDIQTVSYAVPAATTAITTLLITIKVWKVQFGLFNIRIPAKVSREDRIYSGVRLSRKSRLKNIVIVLIESGVAYFLFFLVQVIQIAPVVRDAINTNPNLRFATNVFIYQSSIIVGLYPTIIICLVHANRSPMNTGLCTATGRDSQLSLRDRETTILSSFRAVVPDLSVPESTDGRDEESREEDLSVRVQVQPVMSHQDGILVGKQ